MATDDELEKNESAGSSVNSNGEGAIEVSDDIGTGEAGTYLTIRATRSGHNQWADLEVYCSWAPNGKLLSVTTLRYRATNNGRTKGNIKLRLISGEADTDWDQLLADGGIQNGEWQTFQNTRSVVGNVKEATVGFNFIYDRKNDGDINMTGYKTELFSPQVPTINNPSGDISAPSITVTGTGGVEGAGTITVHNANGDGLLRTASIQTYGNWTATFDMPSGVDNLTFYAVQKIGTVTSAKSNTKTVSLAPTTLITPTENTVIRADQIIFSGTGFSGTQVWAVVPNVGTELSAKVFVSENTTWSTPPKLTLPNGPCTVQAAYQYGGGSVKYTQARTFTVLGKLNINALPAPENMNFTLTGTNGLPNAAVEVKVDWQPEKVGDGTVAANGTWRAEVRLPAGPNSLAAEQIYQTVRSARSAPQAVKIKPPKLVAIDVSYLSSGAVRFSGAGYDTAIVDVHISGNGAPQGSDVVRNGTWSVDWNDAPPGEHQMDIRQKIADGSGWIYSDWSGLPVTIPVPTPTLRVQVGVDRKPVFSGTGHSRLGPPAPQIEVRREGETLPAVPIVEVGNNDAWSSPATEAWDPGVYHVKAWQLFNDLPSDPTELQRFTINAPLPTINVSEDDLTPHFSGTCLNGAQVNLGFDGDQGTPHAATVTGTTWTFTRTEPFIPGSYTARVTQSFGDVTSNEATQPFEIAVLQPVITSPIDIDVDHNPLITGTGGIAGATMTVFESVTEKCLGTGPVTQNAWSVQLEDLAFGSYRVYVVQTYGESPSERSTPVSFMVILFPPTIDHPQPGDDLARGAVIDGYARTVSGTNTAQVELWLDGEDEPLARVRARGFDGYWTYDHDLPVGDYVLRAKQFFAGQPSSFGPDHLFTVVPALPLIESPTPQQHMGSTVTVSGFGYAGDWVEVAWSDAPDTLLGRTQVQANRTWSLPLTIDRPAGPLQWVVQQECNGYRSDWSEAHEVRMLPGAPTFTAPEAGHWFAGTALFEGTGQTGKRIELSHWFDSRQVVSQGDSVTDGTWSASPDAPLLPGPHWMKARQDDSDWADSLRFEVVRVEDNRDR